ncbi:ADP-ribosyltransferase domain-containing protein [Nocardia sp. NPDC051030]|uniref:ADP-ribosyltransferase domain-containing protein n=1 Tax=Nocardia sp. NPDC051030 TaxID=3155162 RepID=UPI003428AE3F
MSPTPTVPLILCRVEEYHSAAEVFGSIATDAATTHIALLGVLNANAGMAGSDSIGQSWATSYDEAAALALSTSERLLTAFSTTANLVSSGAHNHESGEAEANYDTVATPPAPASWPIPCVVTTAASAAGTGIPEPFGWSYVKDLVGAVWPNGHQDKLHSAETAWFTTACDYRLLAQRIPQALTLLGNQQSEEIPRAIATGAERQTDLNALADVCESIAKACGEYAQHLDDAHHQILEELKEFGIETALAEGLFAVAAPFTLGLSELGNLAVGTRFAIKARRVATIIADLATHAAAIVTKTLKPLAERLRPLLSKIGKWVDEAQAKLVNFGRRADEALPPTITQADEDAIRAYTSPYTGLYEDLNSALRAGAVDATQSTQIKAIEEALTKLPDHNGVVFRGTDLPPNVLAEYKTGETVVEKSFTSTTAAAEEAFPGNTQFTIVSKSGKEVTNYSDIPSEQEVLFPPGTAFRVLSNDFDPTTGTTFIRLIQR